LIVPKWVAINSQPTYLHAVPVPVLWVGLEKKLLVTQTWM
jgi:hypothetical protein